MELANGAGRKLLSLCVCYIPHLVLLVIKVAQMCKHLEENAEDCWAK